MDGKLWLFLLSKPKHNHLISCLLFARAQHSVSRPQTSIHGLLKHEGRSVMRNTGTSWASAGLEYFLPCTREPCQRALARTILSQMFLTIPPARMGVTESEARRARGQGRKQGVLAA